MKRIITISLMLFIMAGLISCKEEDTGSLIFKGISVLPQTKSLLQYENEHEQNPFGISYTMHTQNIKFNVVEVWVAKEAIIDGQEDDLTWYSIGKSSGLRFVDELEFTANNLPIGNYYSMKIAFVNRVLRYSVFSNDLSREILMEGSLTEESCPSEDIIYNYFSRGGSYMNYNGKIHRMSCGEYIEGFKVIPDETTHVYWMLGFPGLELTDCSFAWHDNNGNGQWDCSIDLLRDWSCIKEGPMWTFSIDKPADEIASDCENNNQNNNNQEEKPKIEADDSYTVRDIIGNEYKAVKIGSQIWMAENLRTNRLNDSTFIDNYGYDEGWQLNSSIEKKIAQCVYNNDPSTIKTHGRYYNWHTVSTGKLCPQGWHMPSKDEWNTLLEYLGNWGDAPMFMKKLDVGWTFEGTNESKFSALPSGYRHANGSYLQFGSAAYFWSSTEKDENNSYYLNLPTMVTYYTPFEEGVEGEKGAGMNVRCIKD